MPVRGAGHLRALLVLLAISLAVPAQAQGMCGMRTDMIATLKTKYQEGAVAGGIAGQVNLLEVFASKAGTWTIMVTTPQGKSCIIAAGDGWQNYAPKNEDTDT